MVVKARIDACPFNFIEQFCCAVEVVRRMRDQSINGELKIRRPKEACKDRRHYARSAPMGRWILWMGRGVGQRRPVRIRDERRVGAACPDSRYRPPEAEREFGVPASDACVGVSGPQ